MQSCDCHLIRESIVMIAKVMDQVAASGMITKLLDKDGNS